MTHGGLFCTATVGGLMPASASEESRRSSDMVRIDCGELGLQFRRVRGAPVGQSREVDLGDLEILEGHRAQHLVDLRAGGCEDDAKGFRLRMGGLDRERRPEVELIVGPRIDLRLVDQHLGVAEIHAARPRVGRAAYPVGFPAQTRWRRQQAR